MANRRTPIAMLPMGPRLVLILATCGLLPLLTISGNQVNQCNQW